MYLDLMYLTWIGYQWSPVVLIHGGTVHTDSNNNGIEVHKFVELKDEQNRILEIDIENR